MPNSHDVGRGLFDFATYGLVNKYYFHTKNKVAVTEGLIGAGANYLNSKVVYPFVRPHIPVFLFRADQETGLNVTENVVGAGVNEGINYLIHEAPSGSILSRFLLNVGAGITADYVFDRTVLPSMGARPLTAAQAAPTPPAGGPLPSPTSNVVLTQRLSGYMRGKGIQSGPRTLYS